MGKIWPKFKAAAVQAAPVFLDKRATIEKACRLIDEAAGKGADLIAFPETYIPAYPYWPKETRGRALGYKVFVQLYKNSVEIPSADTDVLCAAARKAGAYVVMGLNERDEEFGAALFNSTLFIDRTGKILGKHRKLMPTYGERCVWGMGDGSDLRVFDTDLGKMGSLICGEHFMTLSRYAMFSKGEQVHVAPWPGKEGLTGTVDTMCKSYALEGQCFVIASCSHITPDMVPDSFELKTDTDWSSRGGSGIISPRGQYLAGPLYDQEGIVYADIDTEMIIGAKAMVDVVGHYARWDVASLNLNERPLRPFRSPPTTTPGGPNGLPDELKERARRLGEEIDQLGEAELRTALRSLIEDIGK